MRITLAVAVACLTFGGLAAAGDATAAIRKETHIPAEGLGPALTKLAKEFDFQVLYRTEVIGKLRTEGASGAMTVEEALEHVLSGTGLTYKYLDDKTVTIFSRESSGTADSSRSDQTPSEPGSEANKSKEVGKKTSQDFRVAQVDQGKGSGSVSVASQGSVSRDNTKVPSPGLEEIVVTAQKREERLQDVPIAVSVINAQTLTVTNQVKIADYYTQVPGLSIANNTESAQNIVIRGITTGGFTTPTVGVTIDDVPFGSSSGLVGNLVPDLDPGDLSRLEVLRGPQGTLYGASSMGGLLKFVTIDPSTEGLSGHVDAGTNGVRNGAEPGYNFRGAINVPLSDTFAVRASAFTRQDPGYIDNSILHIKGINEDHAEGGHLSALWQPSETLSLKISALYQRITGDGFDAQSGSGDLQRTDLSIPVGDYKREVQAYSAILKYKIGRAELTALSGYNVNSSSNSYDSTAILGALTKLFFGVTDTPEYINNRDSKFTQEIRLLVPIGQRVDWLMGGFYTHENTPFFVDIEAGNPASGPLLGSLINGTDPATFSEYAAFTDLTFHLTERLDVQVGGRLSHIEQAFGGTNDGKLNNYVLNVVPEQSTTSNPFTYLLTPRFKVSTDLMAYARLASGYRAGGPNGLANGVPTPPYQPDKTKDYEIGVKGDSFNHSFSYDANVYYIDWRNIQLQLLRTVIQNGVPINSTYVGNASAAKSQGVEVSLEWRPVGGLRISGWAAWNDAVLTRDFPPAAVLAGNYGASGDRLPFAARFSSNLSADEEFRLTNRIVGFAGITTSYVGGREDVFTGSAQRQQLPPYAKADLRTGIKYDSWTVNLYANNIFDRRGLISGGYGSLLPQQFYFIQPRTVGLAVSKAF